MERWLNWKINHHIRHVLIIRYSILLQLMENWFVAFQFFIQRPSITWKFLLEIIFILQLMPAIKTLSGKTFQVLISCSMWTHLLWWVWITILQKLWYNRNISYSLKWLITGDSAQIQREPSDHTIQHAVSWNKPTDQAPPTLTVQESGLEGEILPWAL